MYHVMHDDHFVSWPPSPQLAMAVFPYIRSIYYNLWREFVFPHELNLNRQILGLPPADTRGNNREQRRIVERNEGGLLGFLQNVLDALDPEGEENRGGDGENPQGEQEGDNAEGPNRIDVEFVLEADQGAEAALNDIPNGVDGVDDLPGLEAQPRLQPQPQQEAAAQPEQNQENRNNHEAPPAPPARRFELGTLLSNFSNMLVSSLILPGVSFAMGEALRLVLPKSWTTTPPRFAWGQRPGLLQQQWGRSLVGGCLYVVAKDVIRLYTKHRKVAAMSVRRVKNVDRPRRSGNNQQQ